MRIYRFPFESVTAARLDMKVRITMKLRYGAGRRVHPQAAGAHVVVAPLQRACQLFLDVLFDGRTQVFRVLRQLYRGVHHDRRAGCRLRRVNVVDLDADERVRERRHRKRRVDLEMGRRP